MCGEINYVFFSFFHFSHVLQVKRKMASEGTKDSLTELKISTETGQQFSSKLELKFNWHLKYLERFLHCFNVVCCLRILLTEFLFVFHSRRCANKKELNHARSDDTFEARGEKGVVLGVLAVVRYFVPFFV